MLNYYKQEIRDLRNPESDEVVNVYKVLMDRSDTAAQFMRHVQQHSQIGTGVLNAAITEVAECLAERLAEVGSVTVPGVGTFSVAIRRKEKADEEAEGSLTFNHNDNDGSTGSPQDKEAEPNARSIELHHINFRPAKELFNDVYRRLSGKGKFRLVGGKEGVKLSKPVQTRRLDRFAAARDYLASHPFMRVADYAKLTGLSQSSAQRELRLAAQLAHSGIVASGLGSHRFYVLAEKL